MTISTDALDGAIKDEVAVQPAHWGGVLAMTLCVFALIASEFMPVGRAQRQ